MNFYYARDTPEVGDLVVCRIDSISNNSGGYWVELLEYGNQAGFVGLKEITQAKWFKNLRGLAHIGDVEVMQVIAIGDHGDIDLSRRYISSKAKQTVMERYKTWKRVYDYLERMVDEEERENIVMSFLRIYLVDITEKIEKTLEEKENAVKENDEQDKEDNEEDTEDSEEEDDEEDVDEQIVKIAYFSNYPLSKWLQDSEDQFSNEEQEQIIHNIIKLLEKPLETNIQKGNLQLKPLATLSIDKLNKALNLIREQFNVDVTTHSTKTCTFGISSKEKMTRVDFMTILQNIVDYIKNLDPEKLQDEHVQVQQTPKMDGGEQPVLNIGIIGHVAHGKTTLIEALSGVDTRRYKQEVATNRTLNIGYTNVTICKCTCDGQETPIYLAKKDISSACSCTRKTISVVDCPGHNVLLSTMITGAHIMDTCILVVASDEYCPQPQTQEHVAVLQIVGSTEAHFSDGILVQNKIDLINKTRIQSSHNEIEKFVEGTVLENSPIIPISAQLSLNVHHILRFIYEYTCDFEKKKNTRTGLSKGIIVRTFDINKPGSKLVSGAVIGGSIVKGEFEIGEEIMLLPLVIKAKICSMKTEKSSLSKAHVGGLIAIQTDVNPTYCNVLTGCTFVKMQDYNPENLIQSGTLIRCKYNLLTNCNVEKIPKGAHLLINYGGCNSEVVVVKSSSEKYRMTIKTLKPLYVFPEENLTFTIVKDKRLIGFAKSLDHQKVNMPAGNKNVVEFAGYATLLTEFDELLQEWKEKSEQKLKLPVPRTMYKNTFTTIVNFENLCSALEVSEIDLGRYICQELGLKSHSINGIKQLVLKGRTDEKRVISVLYRYIQDKRCILCRRNTIKIIKNMGVKQKVCTHCSWRGTLN